MNVRIPILTSLVNPINGVPVFFLLSGFLIWLSLERDDRFKHFFTRRVLRLYPELWISMIIEIIFLLTLYPYAGITDYIQLVLTQGLFLPSYTPLAFNDYGIGSLNVSLWTIPIIIQFYLLIWFVYRWLKKYSIIIWLAIIAFLIVISALLTQDVQASLPPIFKAVIGLSAGYHLWMFFIGCFIAKFYDKLIPMLTKFWYIPLITLILYEVFPMPIKSIVPYSLTGLVLLALVIFGFGYKFPQIKIKTDISYAVYLYHMIFAGAAIQLGYKTNFYAVLTIVVLTFISAYLSSRIISYIQKK